MENTISRKNGVVIIALKGELDIYSGSTLKNLVEQEITNGSRKLLIDLGEVEYIDSSALGVLVNGLKTARQQNVKFKLTNISGTVERIFDLTRLSKFFEIYPSAEEALASF